MIAWQCTQCAIILDYWAIGAVALSMVCLVALKWRGWKG